jgi:hypothetical protein
MSEKEKEINYDDSHKCCCEKFLCKTDKPWCCINMYDWLDVFQTKINSWDDGYGCCCVICCPVKFPFLLLFLPCTFYNICRNKCNNTTNKNYLC